MSGRSGYANGYGYSDTSRYDRPDGGYGSGGSSSNLGVNGYGAGGGGSGAGSRDRRPGGYGGFYPEASQHSLPPSQSPDRRRDRWEREHEYSSSSRSRTRDREVEGERRLQTSRDGRSQGDASWLANSSSSGERERGRDRDRSTAAAGSHATDGLAPRDLAFSGCVAQVCHWSGSISLANHLFSTQASYSQSTANGHS